MAATIPRRQQVLTFLNTKLFFNFCKADINKAGFVECSDDDANTFNLGICMKARNSEKVPSSGYY